MILVFIILLIIIFLTFTILVFKLSNIKLEIKKLHISNINKKLEVYYVVNIGIYLFNKIPIVKLKLDNYKITNLIQSGKLDIKKINNNPKINRDIITQLNKNEFEIEYFKLEGYFATFNNVLSSWIYAMLNAIMPILIARKNNKQYINNIQFLNINQNIINIKLNCIISMKLVNIINILHYLKKKGGDENNGKSSNRRSYAYSNE